MTKVESHRDSAQEPLDLASAYAELQALILDSPEVTDFLTELCRIAAAVVPGTHCGITLRRGGQVLSVAWSDAVAMRMDEVQYLRGRGPCLEAMHCAEPIEIPDVSAETRWGHYRERALANGVHSVVCLPLVVDGDSIGAVNLFATRPHAFLDTDLARAKAFTDQSAMALTIVMRLVKTSEMDDQLRQALASRAVIDQALGILMYTRQLNAHDAFDLLRHRSQTSNRKVKDLAADLIQSATGHPVEPPRPLSHRD
ncbi:GAF and ANTAR domain-containing protein [Nocardioides sp.]|uniref:GAF and ANTAR domain-containing protein n=1 Tax=Nocardioides sp. TaxID=35761 RepID=UPI003D129759